MTTDEYRKISNLNYSENFTKNSVFIYFPPPAESRALSDSADITVPE